MDLENKLDMSLDDLVGQFSQDNRRQQGGPPQGAGVCYDWQKGQCSRSNCRFSHDGQGGGGGDGGGGGFGGGGFGDGGGRDGLGPGGRGGGRGGRDGLGPGGGGRGGRGPRAPPPEGPIRVGRRCYVGNLSWKTSWQDLKDHFRTCGTVVYADVMREASGRSRGCGIVEFENAEEAAVAIETMNDVELEGRLIFVREDREDRDLRASKPPRNEQQ